MAQFGAIGYLHDAARLGYVIFDECLYFVYDIEAAIIKDALRDGNVIRTETRELDPNIHVCIPYDQVYVDDERLSFLGPHRDVHIVLRNARHFNMSMNSRSAMRREFMLMSIITARDDAKNIRNTLADAGIQV